MNILVLAASPEVFAAVDVFRAEIERIWEPTWRFTYDVVVNGVADHDDFIATLNSNPVLSSLFQEMQSTAYIWKQADMSIDEIPPVYSVRPIKLESLLKEVVK